MAANQQTPQAPADNAKDIKDNKTTSSKKLKTGEVKDQISKGSTMVGRTEANPSGKPDQIDINPMQNEGILSQLNAIYDRVLDEIEEDVDSVFEDNQHGLYKYNKRSGMWDHQRSVTAETKDQWLHHFKKDDPNDHFVVSKNKPKHNPLKEDVDSVFEDKFGKNREAIPRSGQDRNKIDLVVRDGSDRKKSDKAYRQQSIEKNVIDEKYGKGYVSPASKIEKAMKAKGIQPDSGDKYRQEMEKNSAAYQAILDREAAAKNKTNEEVLGCDIDDLTEEELGFTEENFIPSGNELYEDWNELEEEAEYQGRKVKLGKPFLTPGGPKKRSVYVKNEGGNIVKVNFGDPNMTIKKNIPARRKSFRARHHCDTNPGPRTKARYWSCRAW